MKRLFEVVLVDEGKIKPLQPPQYFERKLGSDGAKEYRRYGNSFLPKGKYLRIAFGPDHKKGGGDHAN